MNKSKRIIFLILVSGLLLRFFLFFGFLDNQELFYDDDSLGYVQLAENMKEGRGFSWDEKEPFRPNSFRTPGYPLFLLLNRLLFGSYLPALLVQFLLVAASAYILFLIAESLGSRRIGEIGAAIFLFMPFSVLVSLQFLTQSLFAFVLMLAVWFWLLFLKKRQTRYFLFVSALLPVLALIRPIAIFLYLPFVISLFQSLWTSDKKRTVYLSAFLILIFFLLLSPWLLRNYLLFGEYSLSSIGPYQLYFYEAPPVYAFNHNVSRAEAGELLEREIEKYTHASAFEEYPTFAHSDILSQKGREIIFESPAGLVFLKVIQGFKFFIRDGIRYWLEQRGLGLVLTERAFLFVIFLGMIASLSSFLKKDFPNRPYHFFFILIIFYFAFLTGAMASAGFRFVVEPLFILTGLTGVKQVISMRRSKKIY